MKKVIVIGAGPGGYEVAKNLSEAGQKVVIIERKQIGGTCLNVGCIPTKALLDHLSLYEHFLESSIKKSLYKFQGEVKINQEGLIAYQKEVIEQLQQGIKKELKRRRIDVLYGTARIASKSKIVVQKDTGEEIEEKADEIVIATGSKPKKVPSFELDGKLIVSSDEVWNIPDIPKKLLIVGTGPIGIEFARIFKTLGSSVILTEIKETICPILDKEISENLQRGLKRRGIKAIPNTASKQVGKKTDLVKVKFLSVEGSKNDEEEFNQVLIAVGRTPNIEELNLEKVGVELDGEGFIKTDRTLKTTVNNIWAIGDVTNYPQLAHTASFQAKVVAENIIRGKNLREFDHRFIPACIYGYPEIAFVGKTEEELKEEKINYVKGISLFLASGKAKASGLTEGLVKVLIHKETKEILGAHIIGPEASNLIHELVIAMQNNLTVNQIINSIHAHPTYSETVYEAAENSLRQIDKVEIGA